MSFLAESTPQHVRRARAAASIRLWRGRARGRSPAVASRMRRVRVRGASSAPSSAPMPKQRGGQSRLASTSWSCQCALDQRLAAASTGEGTIFGVIRSRRSRFCTSSRFFPNSRPSAGTSPSPGTASFCLRSRAPCPSRRSAGWTARPRQPACRRCCAARSAGSGPSGPEWRRLRYRPPYALPGVPDCSMMRGVTRSVTPTEMGVTSATRSPVLCM